MNPKVICHVMGSVDGRLLTGRWTEPFNGKSKSGLMGVYAAIGRRLNTDAWMFGKNTLCEGFFPGKFHTQDTAPLACPEPYVAGKASPASLWSPTRKRTSSMSHPRYAETISLSSCRKLPLQLT